MISAEQFIETFPLFRDAPSGLVEKILAASIQKNFEKDTYIYLEGDACPGIALVLSGEIRVFKIGEGGRELTLYEIFPGDTCIMNASCILGRRKYPANAAGLTAGTMLYLEENAFRDMVAHHEVMRTFIFKYFSNRYIEIVELVAAMAFHRMDLRLAEYLLTKATNNTIQSTHQKIANDLGTSREVVSRLLKDMEQKGKVHLSRNRIDLLAPLFL
jgi:CRP/FNR family transcriptional regulator